MEFSGDSCAHIFMTGRATIRVFTVSPHFELFFSFGAILWPYFLWWSFGQHQSPYGFSLHSKSEWGVQVLDSHLCVARNLVFGFFRGCLEGKNPTFSGQITADLCSWGVLRLPRFLICNLTYSCRNRAYEYSIHIYSSWGSQRWFFQIFRRTAWGEIFSFSVLFWKTANTVLEMPIYAVCDLFCCSSRIL